jgi:hypothetical protein
VDESTAWKRIQGIVLTIVVVLAAGVVTARALGPPDSGCDFSHRPKLSTGN